jgi:nucleoside-diphosphate-sugar epimerase
MQLANSSVSYELDNTAAREDFGWRVRYQLHEMVKDFIGEIKAGRAG